MNAKSVLSSNYILESNQLYKDNAYHREKLHLSRVVSNKAKEGSIRIYIQSR